MQQLNHENTQGTALRGHEDIHRQESPLKIKAGTSFKQQNQEGMQKEQAD
jgi:hypothetical protein